MILHFEELHGEIKRHAVDEYPKESCGIILEVDGNLEYIRIKNDHSEPEKHFELNYKQYIKAKYTGEIKAIVHSHNGYPHASKHDMEEQIKHGVPYGLVFTKGGAVIRFGNYDGIVFWGDQLEPQKFVGRPFVHGIWDCYGLVRDYHIHQLGVYMNQYPREWKWWFEDENLLLNNVKDEGFIFLNKEPKDIEKNDCILMSLGKTKFINHCGVYLGANLLLHHVCTKSTSLSKTEPLTSVGYNEIKYIVRHKDLC